MMLNAWKWERQRNTKLATTIPHEVEPPLGKRWSAIDGLGSAEPTPGQFAGMQRASAIHRAAGPEKRLMLAVLEEATVDAIGLHGGKPGAVTCARCSAWRWFLSNKATVGTDIPWVIVSEALDIEPTSFLKAMRRKAMEPWKHPENAPRKVPQRCEEIRELMAAVRGQGNGRRVEDGDDV